MIVQLKRGRKSSHLAVLREVIDGEAGDVVGRQANGSLLDVVLDDGVHVDGHLAPLLEHVPESVIVPFGDVGGRGVGSEHDLAGRLVADQVELRLCP